MGSPAIRKRHRITWRHQTYQDTNSTGLRRPLDFQADSAGAAIDQRKLAAGVRQIRIFRTSGTYGVGWTTPADVSDVASNGGVDWGETQSGRVGIRFGDV